MICIQQFMEQNAQYDRYHFEHKYGVPVDDCRYNHTLNLPVTETRFAAHTCPSDIPNTPIGNITSHNYSANYGNTSYGRTPSLNGVVFAGAPFSVISTGTTDRIVGFASIIDGLSNTLLVGEVLQGQAGDLRGFTWWGDASSFTTYLPPNSNLPDRIYDAVFCENLPDHNLPCAVSSSTDPTMFALRSRHPGGVNASLCDGSTRFISETIDLNTYRALSTTQGGEVVGDF